MRLLGIPEGLTNRKCEKCEPKLIGGYPPIRFIPEKAIEDEEVDGKKVNTVKVNINASVTKTFRAFAKGGPEAVIKLIRNHESLVGDKKLKEIYTSASALWNEKKKAIEEFATTSDKSRDKSHLKILNREMKEHTAACMSAQEDAFDFFEKLLSSENVERWRSIIKEQCKTASYIDLNGKKNTNGKARGRVFAALEPCYIAVMLVVTTQDTAERHKQYWTTTVKKPERSQFKGFHREDDMGKRCGKVSALLETQGRQSGRLANHERARNRARDVYARS